MDVKVVSLSVIPIQASLLSFEVPGIIGEFNVELGSPVSAFDFALFYDILSAMPAIADDLARLEYDVRRIKSYVKADTLAGLRAEASKAALRKAINLRANSFYAKYANAADLIEATQRAYSASRKGSKSQYLLALKNISELQNKIIERAYKDDDRLDVVLKKTISVTKTGGDWDWQPTSSVEVDNDTYRVPSLENFATHQRQQIGIIDEAFNLFANNQNLDYLENVFQNELSAIDSEVYRMQIAYLNTILISPISGVVTAIYKKLGEAVQAGEPVLRVENNDYVYLTATLISHGAIELYSIARVETKLFDTVDTMVEGPVVSTRCNDTDDQWNIVVKCGNMRLDGLHILPLGYRFDFDKTTILIKTP